MADHDQLIAALETWYQTPLGATLIDVEKHALEHLLPQIFGYHLVQLGGPCHIDMLANCKIPHRVKLCPETNHQYLGPCVQSIYEELPFVPGSIDAIVILQVLAFADNPRQVLQQCYDAVRADGELVIFGFNRLSLWGLGGFLFGKKQTPWHGIFLPAYKVRRMLTEVGFSVVDYQTLLFRPPFTSATLLEHTGFWETIGNVCWPNFGGIYMIRAKKQQVPVTPLWDKILARRSRIRDVATQPTSNNTEY